MSTNNQLGKFATVSRGNGLGLMRMTTLACALAFAWGSPAAADPFGSMLKSVVPGMPGMPSQPQQQQQQQQPGAANQSGAMNMAAPTPVAPLHGLGTDAVAMVEDASDTTSVQAMDYVFDKQSIELGKKGKVTLGFLAGCRSEKIHGGTVTVGTQGSAVAGGKLTTAETPNCKAPTPIILASASEAGATVNRITPFSTANWNERAIKSPNPVFKWNKGMGEVTIRVKDMDKDGEPVVWEMKTDKDWIAYPPKGEPLVKGTPYKVEAVAGERVMASALFSIDPSLDVADNMANRLVPLANP